MAVEACEVDKKFLPDKNGNHRVDSRSSIKRQVLASVVANLTVLSSGMGLGYPATTLSLLTDPTSAVALTEAQGSWVASINTIFSPVGGLIASYTLDKFGRKNTLMVINILSIISWAVIAFSSKSDVNLMYMEIIGARILIGIVAGLSSSPSAVYSAEIASPRLRGRLTVFTSVSISSGALVIYVLGYFIKNDWRLVSGIAGIICVCAFCALYFVPESPRWLLMKNRVSQAEKSLKRLNGKHQNCQEELQQLSQQIRGNQEIPGKSLSRWEMLQRPEFYKPLAIMMGFFTFQQFTGTFVLVVYAVKFSVSAGVTMDPFLFTVILGVARVAGSIILGGCLDVLGRRLPTIAGGILVGVSLFGIVLCMWNPCPMTNWIAGFLIFFFVLTSTVSFLVVPFVMIAEIYPQRMRGFASGITVSYAYVLCFLCIKIYPTLLTTIGSDYICLMYGTMAFLGVLFVYNFLPETNKKTLQEIEDFFVKKIRSIRSSRMSDKGEKDGSPPPSINVIVVEESIPKDSDDAEIVAIIKKRYMNDIPIVIPRRKNASLKKVEEKQSSIKETDSEDFVKGSNKQDKEVQTQTICVLSKIVADYQRRLDLMVCLNMLSTGMSLAYPALLFDNFESHVESHEPQSRLESRSFNFNKEEKTWISSLNILTPILGVILSGFFKARGGKKTFILVGLINTLSWLMMYLSFFYTLREYCLAQILLARFFHGISSGFIRLMAMIFEAKNAFTNLRGALTLLPAISLSFGILLVTIFAIIFSKKCALICIGCCIVCLLTTIVTIMVKDSPEFSMESPEDDEEFVINRRIGKSDNEGYSLIFVRNLQEVISFGKRKIIINDDYRDFIRHFRHKHLHKPILLYLVIAVFFVFSGFTPFCVYTGFILKSLDVKHVEYVTLGLSITRLTVSCLAMLCILKTGRTYIFMASGLMMTGSLAGIILMKNFLDDHSTMIALFATLFVFFNYLGFVSMIHVLMAEIMPRNFRSTTSSLFIVFHCLMRFLIIKTFPAFTEAIGIDYVLMIFSIFSFLSVLFVLFFVPETHKKTAEEIPQLFGAQ
ncbi:uncharacterized protein LOC132263835 [Phlebotomus argentipes]|uniref:uncharacterized protein LOC132263835 n=1 Tax=Phlebotomus argentipes TaxID=94469 RepID=UPI0028931A7F|nr:uncharacterized protein LOC132263835 [Phlebotomus argentipes]